MVNNINETAYTQLTIAAPAQWEDILSGLLFAYGAPGVETDDPAIISAHLAAGDWDASVFDGQALPTGRVVLRALFAPEVPAGLYDDIAALCPDEPELFSISSAPLPAQDWQQMWRDFFPTLLLGEKLAVTPHWRQDELPANTVPLYIAPGLAFGTGDHATTALTAELLQKYLQPGQAVLDIGCGSGILAIAALKLGASRALALDIDIECARSVDEHRKLNNISEEQLPFLCGDILSEGALQQACGAFAADIVLSNIVAGIIAALAAYIAAYMKPGGLWISSGILLEKEAAVQAAMAEHGWQVIERCVRGEWVALAARMGV